MHEGLAKILEETCYGEDQCKWCNSLVLTVHGDSEQGIYRVDCGDCGARFTRMSRPQAIAWAALQIHGAVQIQVNALAQEAYHQLREYWGYGTGLASTDMVWVQTRAGSGGDDDDECPF